MLDTGVIISLIDRQDQKRKEFAKSIYTFLISENIKIVYSQRTKNELQRKPSKDRLDFLSNHEMTSYFLGNEKWEQIEGTCENIASLWNINKKETQLYNRLNKWLRKNRDLQDRGILLDAVFNNCRYFIHENPNDFKKVPIDFWEEFKIVEIDLINNSIEEIKNKYSG